MQEYPQLLAELGQPAPPPGTPPQLQTADNFETMGMASYEHIFSSNALLDVRGMGPRQLQRLLFQSVFVADLVTQHNDFREGYFNASLAVHHDRQEWKVGIESDNIFLHEDYRDMITANPNYPGYPFDPGTETPFTSSATGRIWSKGLSCRISFTSATGR